jgi:erythromycin esterase
MLHLPPVTGLISPVLVAVLVLVPPYAASGAKNGLQTAPPPRCESASESFVAWARKNAVAVPLASDASKQPYLERLQKATADARIVAIGEAQRRVEEFYQFRSRLFRSLVMNGGFTALAMETGFVEAMKLNDYVMGRGLEPTDWQKWFTNGYGDEAALQSDLRWIRAYNREPTHTRKIHFYGIDLMVPYSSPLTALTATFEYLDQVDPSFASAPTRKALLLTVQGFLGSGDSRANLALSFRRYTQVSEPQRNEYTAHLADLIARFEANRLDYVARSSEEAFAWARQAAIVARQLDNAYRVMLAGGAPKRDGTSLMWPLRDAVMMENVTFALEREGAGGRLVVWAHNAHLSKGSVPSTRPETDVIRLWEAGPRLGMHLDAALGKQYFAIGSTFYEGESGWQRSRGPAECGTVAGELARIDVESFLLDLRSARKQQAAKWLDGARVLRADNPASDYLVVPSRAFDSILFVRRVSPVGLVLAPR